MYIVWYTHVQHIGAILGSYHMPNLDDLGEGFLLAGVFHVNASMVSSFCGTEDEPTF